jgi:hypothetical protein
MKTSVNRSDLLLSLDHFSKNQELFQPHFR